MTMEAAQPADTPAAPGWASRQWRSLMTALAKIGVYYRFTSIQSRIVALNFLGVAVLIAGTLVLNNFRDALIEARIKSLEIEADIIARSIAQNSTNELDAVTTSSDPIDALEAEATQASAEFPAQKPFAIKVDDAAQLLRRLIEPTKTHGYIFNIDGSPLVDSSKMYKAGQMQRIQQPATTQPDNVTNPLYLLWLKIESFIGGEVLPEHMPGGPKDGMTYHEVRAALESGNINKMVRINPSGETILCVAAPIRRGTPVLGALLLTTQAGELDGLVAAERISLINFAIFVLAVMLASSMLLAGTIAGPMKRLAKAAELVRGNIKKRTEIPDFSHRSDEIGELSGSLREMTSALYKRLDAIEDFAADVAHELKNPLTSLRSAADTLTLVKSEEDRERLVQIIQQDVKRMNRLITDISDSSRLDSELAREARKPVNIAKQLDGLCTIVNDIHREGAPQIELKFDGVPRGAALNGALFTVQGHEGRLGQVMNNLLDNAISFSPPGGKILVTCRRIAKVKEVEITVEDEGRGIPADNLDRIFDRFYTDRPDHEEFGQNSGLGLHISRQIIEAHKGRIWAENRTRPCSSGEPEAVEIAGARFFIRLPALP